MADTVKRAAWTFAQAFVGAFLVLAAGLATVHNVAEGKAVVGAAIAGGIAAGVSAVKNLLFPQGSTVR